MILAGAHGGKSAAARFRVEAEAVARSVIPGSFRSITSARRTACRSSSWNTCPGGSLEKSWMAPLAAAKAARLVEVLALAIAEAHRGGLSTAI